MEGILSRHEFADRTVPDCILEYLATELAGEWQLLARYLNISDADLHNIKADNSGRIQDTKYFMLRHWSERNGAWATYRVLAKALDKAGRRDLQKYVESQVEQQEEKRSDISSKEKAPDPSSVKQPSTSASDRVVTTAAIQNLSRKMFEEWRIVGRKLGIGELKLQIIDTDNRTAQEKVYQMLLTWKQSKGNEATYILLGEALQSAGRKDLQEYSYQQDKTVEQQEEKSSDVSSKGKASDHSSVKQPSTSASDRVVTTAAIQDLSHTFWDEWRIVGSKLGIGEPKLQTIDTDNRTAQEKVYQMLLTWKQSKGNEATCRLLGEALQSAGRKDLQEYLYQQACDHYYEQRYGDNSQEGRRSIEEPIHPDERQSEVERTPKELHVGSDGLSTSSDSGDQPIKIKHRNEDRGRRRSKISLTTETERASVGGGTGQSSKAP